MSNGYIWEIVHICVFLCNADQILYYFGDRRKNNAGCIRLVDLEQILVSWITQTYPICNVHCWFFPAVSWQHCNLPSKVQNEQLKWREIYCRMSLLTVYSLEVRHPRCVVELQEQVFGTYVCSQKHNYIPYSTFTILRYNYMFRPSMLAIVRLYLKHLMISYIYTWVGVQFVGWGGCEISFCVCRRGVDRVYLGVLLKYLSCLLLTISSPRISQPNLSLPYAHTVRLTQC